VETVLVVIFFALFSAVVAFIIRPRNRRRSRRRIALSAATDQPGPPFIERRRAIELMQPFVYLVYDNDRNDEPTPGS
jgi:hypothetical protein